MADRKDVVPHRPLDVEAAIGRTADLLRIWEVDLETIDHGELRALCRAGAEALRDGQVPRIRAALAPVASKQAIALGVDKLIAAYPGMRKDVDLSTFSLLLAEEVYRLAPSAGVLEAAIRTLIRGRDFPPSIKEVLDAVTAQKAEWDARLGLLDRLPGRILAATRLLGEG